MSDEVNTNSVEQPVYQNDVGGPAAERDSRLPRDTSVGESYAEDVAAAMAKLRGGEPAVQARDEHGRFAAKEPADAEAPQAPEELPTEDKQDAQAEPQESKPAAGPPPGWSAESKEAFAQLPASVQQDVLKRETEVSDGFRQMSEKVKAWNEVEGVMAPRRQAFAANGFRSDAQVINQLLSYADAMERNPAGTLKLLAESYGVNLGAAQPTAQEDEFVAPEVAELRKQNAALMQRIQAVEGTFAQQSQAQLRSEIAKFAAGKPHFEKVRPIMGALLDKGAAPDLETAYQMAVYADPGIRASVLAEEAAKKSAAEEAQRKAMVAKQKQAAVQVKGSPASAPALQAKPAAFRGDDRDDIRADVLNAVRLAASR